MKSVIYGSLGGKAVCKSPKGFAANKELARIVGAKGGRISGPIAGEVIYVEANGPSTAPEVSIDYTMSLAVNDQDDLAVLAYDYWQDNPGALREQLGDKAELVDLVPVSYFRELEGGERLT